MVSDSSVLEVMDPVRDLQTNTIDYPIRLLDTAALWNRESLDVSVNLICSVTDQEVKVPVNIRLIGQKPEYLGWYTGSLSLMHKK